MQVSSRIIMGNIGWWAMMLVCFIYALFALTMAGIEMASWIAPGIESKLRALPKIFVIHAVSGAVTLLTGPLQFRGSLRRRSPALHRISGRAYVFSAWIASVTAALISPFFNVSTAAQIAFEVLAILWFMSTTIGMKLAIKRQIVAHREWMLRSFALSLFFISGSLWMDISRSLPFAKEVTYPLAIYLGWVLNLSVTELWIRYRLRPRSFSQHS